MLTEKLSAESQMLTVKLKKEEKKQEALVGDIVELRAYSHYAICTMSKHV